MGLSIVLVFDIWILFSRVLAGAGIAHFRGLVDLRVLPQGHGGPAVEAGIQVALNSCSANVDGKNRPLLIDSCFFFFLARNVPPVESRSVCTVSPGNARWARTSLASVSSSLRKTDASINFAVRFLKPCKWVSFLCARQFTFPCEVDFASRYVVRISNLEVGVFFSRVLLRYLVRYLSFLVISSSFFFPTLLKKGGRG